MNLFIRDRHHPQYPAHSSQVMRHLGLDPKGKLPEDGMPPRKIDGIRVWVEPLLPKDERRARDRKFMATRPHRVMAECPLCYKAMSAGRLPQHAKVHQH